MSVAGNSIPEPSRSGLKRWGGSVLKLAFIAAALGWVFGQTDIQRLAEILLNTSLLWVIVAFLLLNLAQLASALRMRFYFRANGQEMPPYFATALYYIGMFYNNVLPGGLGGDGYKMYYLKRHAQFPLLKGFRALLSDRASGLFVLCLIMLALGFASNPVSALFGFWLWPLLAILMLGYFLSARWILKDSLSVTLGGTFYSLAVQGLTTLTAVALLIGMGVSTGLVEYTLIFLLASILGAILPISVGGVGIRELTFYYAAALLPIDAERGVAFALGFFAVYFLSSFIGLFLIPRLKHIPIESNRGK